MCTYALYFVCIYIIHVCKLCDIVCLCVLESEYVGFLKKKFLGRKTDKTASILK